MNPKREVLVEPMFDKSGRQVYLVGVDFFCDGKRFKFEPRWRGRSRDEALKEARKVCHDEDIAVVKCVEAGTSGQVKRITEETLQKAMDAMDENSEAGPGPLMATCINNLGQEDHFDAGKDYPATVLADAEMLSVTDKDGVAFEVLKERFKMVDPKRAKNMATELKVEKSIADMGLMGTDEDRKKMEEVLEGWQTEKAKLLAIPLTKRNPAVMNRLAELGIAERILAAVDAYGRPIKEQAAKILALKEQIEQGKAQAQRLETLRGAVTAVDEDAQLRRTKVVSAVRTCESCLHWGSQGICAVSQETRLGVSTGCKDFEIWLNHPTENQDGYP